MESHARQVLSAEIEQLEHDLLEMGSRAESMVGQAIEALCTLDAESAKAVLLRDDEIDELDLAIENHCLRMLALQQPMASDLRVIGTAMKMITDLERVGDLSVDIAKIALKIEKEFGQTDFIDLHRIGAVAREMLLLSLESFVKRDLALVEQVCARDDVVDELYRAMRDQIHRHMREQPDEVVSASWLLLAIHHVERIADHAVNIAERVSFMVTGELKQLVESHRSDQPHA